MTSREQLGRRHYKIMELSYQKFLSCLDVAEPCLVEFQREITTVDAHEQLYFCNHMSLEAWKKAMTSRTDALCISASMTVDNLDWVTDSAARRMQGLYIFCVPNLTAEALLSFISRAPQLTSLTIQGCPHVTTETLVEIFEDEDCLSNLKHLGSDSRLKNEAIEALAGCPLLESISFASRTHCPTNEAFEQLVQAGGGRCIREISMGPSSSDTTSDQLSHALSSRFLRQMLPLGMDIEFEGLRQGPSRQEVRDTAPYAVVPLERMTRAQMIEAVRHHINPFTRIPKSDIKPVLEAQLLAAGYSIEKETAMQAKLRAMDEQLPGGREQRLQNEAQARADESYRRYYAYRDAQVARGEIRNLGNLSVVEMQRLLQRKGLSTIGFRHEIEQRLLNAGFPAAFTNHAAGTSSSSSSSSSSAFVADSVSADIDSNVTVAGTDASHSSMAVTTMDADADDDVEDVGDSSYGAATVATSVDSAAVVAGAGAVGGTSGGEEEAAALAEVEAEGEGEGIMIVAENGDEEVGDDEMPGAFITPAASHGPVFSASPAAAAVAVTEALTEGGEETGAVMDASSLSEHHSGMTTAEACSAVVAVTQQQQQQLPSSRQAPSITVTKCTTTTTTATMDVVEEEEEDGTTARLTQDEDNRRGPSSSSSSSSSSSLTAATNNSTTRNSSRHARTASTRSSTTTTTTATTASPAAMAAAAVKAAAAAAKAAEAMSAAPSGSNEKRRSRRFGTELDGNTMH